MNATAILELDKRRQKNDGTYPLKMKITYNREKRRYGVGINLLEKDYKNFYKSSKFKKHANIANIYLNKAYEIIETLNSDFNFLIFEKLFFEKEANSNKKSNNVFILFENYIKELNSQKKIKTAICYQYSLNKLKTFHNKTTLPIELIDKKFLHDFDAYMKLQDLSYTTIGIYMRNLRRIFNVAIADGIVSTDQYPFGRNKYIPPTSRNIKKSITLEEIHKIYNYHPQSEMEEWARDMWMFSYFSNGINFKDIVLLKWSAIDYKQDLITIIREKTKNSLANKQSIEISLIDDTKEIIHKWGKRESLYVFGLIEENSSAERITKSVSQIIKNANKYLGRISDNLELSRRITTNFARHSYSTVLKRAGVPIEMISEQLGHASIKTTQIYLDSFEKEQKRETTKFLAAFKNMEVVK